MDGFFSTGFGLAVLIAAQSLLVVGFVMISLLFLVYGDRKIWAAVQMRRGPNVVGPFGLLQSVADALKYVVKEIVVPAGADRFVFFLAPMLSFVLAVIAWAVIPFNDTWVLSDAPVNAAFSLLSSTVTPLPGQATRRAPIVSDAPLTPTQNGLLIRAQAMGAITRDDFDASQVFTDPTELCADVNLGGKAILSTSPWRRSASAPAFDRAASGRSAESRAARMPRLMCCGRRACSWSASHTRGNRR